MSDDMTLKRLVREYRNLQKDPIPFITAKPLENNLFKWHYAIEGPPDSPYEGGVYFGTLTFPKEYPFKPPNIQMITPSGRFAPQKDICLSISNHHPESWNPSWSAATILNGLLSFMMGDDITLNSIVTSDEEKIRLAKSSVDFNKKQSTFVKVFPELVSDEKPKPGAETQKPEECRSNKSNVTETSHSVEKANARINTTDSNIVHSKPIDSNNPISSFQETENSQKKQKKFKFKVLNIFERSNKQAAN